MTIISNQLCIQLLEKIDIQILGQLTKTDSQIFRQLYDKVHSPLRNEVQKLILGHLITTNYDNN